MGIVNPTGSPFVNNSSPSVQDKWLNSVQDEINNVISSVSQSISDTELNQLGNTISSYSGDGDFFTDSGAVNSYVLTVIASKRPPLLYTAGQRVRFVPGNTNSGASTINVVGIGVVGILDPAGAPLTGGEIISGIALELYYDGAAFRLSNVSGAVNVTVDKVSKAVNQTAHAFVAGNVIRKNGANFVKAQANNEANSQVVGVVESVQGVDDFTFVQVGFVSTLSGLVAGNIYYLDSVTPGVITNVKPTTAGEFVVPVFIAESTNAGYVLSQRGIENVTIVTDADRTERTVTQVAHGFAVGEALRLSGATYGLAIANASNDSNVVGVVQSVTDVDNFVLVMSGYIDGQSGLVAGSRYFLSPTVAGALTTTEPTAASEFSVPVLIADSTTTGYVTGQRSNPSVASFDTGISKAWINFNGIGTVAINGSFNVSSLVDNGVGQYTVNLTNSFANANYSVVSSGFDPGTVRARSASAHALATGSFDIRGTDSGGANEDLNPCFSAAFGDLA